MRNAAVLAGFGLSLLATLGRPSEACAKEETHDGFYLQLHAGVGYYTVSADTPFDESFSGVTFASAVLLGGSVAPGFALGGGFITDYASSPTYRANGQEFSTTDLSQYVVGLGPFIDYYPDPKGGLHFQGLFGFGGLETSANGNVGGSDPTGLLLSLGAGHEWWIGEEWSVGVMGRVIYAPLSLNDVAFPTLAPALLATFTYH